MFLKVVIKKVQQETKTRWTEEQKKVVKEYFRQNIDKKVPPKQRECSELKEKYPSLLENKDWLKIKVFIQNEYTKKRNDFLVILHFTYVVFFVYLVSFYLLVL